jgi:hypothetical protein
MNKRKSSKIESEISTILNGSSGGSKLSRFEDWAAGRSPEDIRLALRFIALNAEAFAKPRPGQVITMPNRDERFSESENCS